MLTVILDRLWLSLERLEARIPRGLGGPGVPGGSREDANGDTGEAVGLLQRLEARRVPGGC